MAFLHLQSENKDLSWVIEKNPATKLVIKELREGHLFGYFPIKNNSVIDTEYCIYFRDASDEVSYKEYPDQQFEYLSSSRYTNPRFINDAIDGILRSAKEGRHIYQTEGKEYDKPTNHKIFFNVIGTQYKTIDIFQRYFTELKFTSEEIVINNYKLTIESTTPMTLSYFLNIISLFGVFAVLNTDDFIYMHSGMTEKYMKVLNVIDPPYFIRYLFKVRLLRDKSKFEKFQSELQTTKRYNQITITFGDSHEGRKIWAKEHLPIDKAIVDIGVGNDFQYLKIFAPKLKDSGFTYYAIEKDEEARRKIKNGCRNRAINNVEIYESLEGFLEVYDNQPVNVLCTEVLEHNEFSEATNIIKTVISKTNFDKFLITVPNATFNQFYGIEGLKRHDDHKWEYSYGEFKRQITDFLNINCKNVITDWFSIGDIIENVAVTTGLIITSNNE